MATISITWTADRSESRRLFNRLKAILRAAFERLNSPPRDVPPEFYRFPTP